MKTVLARHRLGVPPYRQGEDLEAVESGEEVDFYGGEEEGPKQRSCKGPRPSADLAGIGGQVGRFTNRGCG